MSGRGRRKRSGQCWVRTGLVLAGPEHSHGAGAASRGWRKQGRSFCQGPAGGSQPRRPLTCAPGGPRQAPHLGSCRRHTVLFAATRRAWFAAVRRRSPSASSSISCVPSPRHCERRGPRLRSRPLAPRGQHPPGGQGLSRTQEPLFSRRALLPQTGLLRGPELELMSLSSPVMQIGFSARGPVRQLRVAELTWSRSSLTVFRKPGCVSFPS